MKYIKNEPATTGQDLTGKAGYCVKWVTDGMTVTSAITDQVQGILSGTPDTVGGDVTKLGVAMGKLGGTVTRGQYVTSHTDGTIVASAGAGCQEFGIAEESGIAGDFINILVLGCPKTFA